MIQKVTSKTPNHPTQLWKPLAGGNFISWRTIHNKPGESSRPNESRPSSKTTRGLSSVWPWKKKGWFEDVLWLLWAAFVKAKRLQVLKVKAPFQRRQNLRTTAGSSLKRNCPKFPWKQCFQETSIPLERLPSEKVGAGTYGLWLKSKLFYLRQTIMQLDRTYVFSFVSAWMGHSKHTASCV